VARGILFLLQQSGKPQGFIRQVVLPRLTGLWVVTYGGIIG